MPGIVAGARHKVLRLALLLNKGFVTEQSLLKGERSKRDDDCHRSWRCTALTALCKELVPGTEHLQTTGL